MWEESPIGTWTLEVINDGKSLVELKHWSLVFLGTETHPQPALQNSPRSNTLQMPLKPASKQNTNSLPETNINQVKPDSAPKKDPSQPAVDVTNMNVAKAASKITLENCIEQPVDSLECKKCHQNFMLLNGKCVHKCPGGYYTGEVGYDHHKTCLKCYYSCKTCTGPNDYQCTSCFEDAIIEEESHGQTFCHNKSLNDQVKHTSRWYYVLSIGFMINFCIILVLIIYIVR